MGRLDWDHNGYYHRLLLRQLPRGCDQVLEVGCGAGAFAVKLARRAGQVDALDRSPVMIEAARRVTPANVSCILSDVMRDPLPADRYDAIVSVTALHHLPLDDALRRLSGALRPGGVLAAVALPRRDLPRELPAELLAATGHRVLGAAFAGLRASGHGGWYRLEPGRELMPTVLDPPLTTHQVRQHATAALPGAQVRRLVFWRYLLLWHRPAACSRPLSAL
ncbi:MAG TPA: class I SAM-dependent methyltransferase [Streptosporangiaceae bacterium]|nr:class I SAM-dependent methyltransferase [Streptosporangiaceae bacterium]